MADFFTDLFLHGLPASSDSYASVWFWKSLLMLLACLVLVYLVTIILISFTSLYHNPDTLPLVDVDARIHFCCAWALLAIFVFVSAVIFWLWYRGEIVPEKEVWLRAKAIASHWTVLVILFVIWVAIYWNRRSSIKRLQKGIPNV
jgi:hypothetical protein